MIVINIAFYLLLSIGSFYLATNDAKVRYYGFLGATIGGIVQKFFSIMGGILLFLMIPEIAALLI
tara:strand:+ start:929 stop:1123 length:195 start_codon:yes stop_codon:yes gene_type:complete